LAAYRKSYEDSIGTKNEMTLNDLCLEVGKGNINH